MFPSFEKCVGAIADTLVRQEMQSADRAQDAGTIATFLLASHARMPDHLRLAFRVLTLVFDSWSYPTAGKPFHQLSVPRRLDQVSRWGASRLQFRHALITFFRTLTTFGLYSEIYKQDYEFGSHSEQD
jgi:hypothetical protein